jgi:non-ribosomal peptide synthetase component F
MFALQNQPAIPELKLGEVTMEEGSFENATSKFDLSFFLSETNSGLQGSVRYCTDLFNKETILRLVDHFRLLLESYHQGTRSKHQCITNTYRSRAAQAAL